MNENNQNNALTELNENELGQETDAKSSRGKLSLKDAVTKAKMVASKTGEAAKKAADASKPVLKKAGEKAVVAKDKGIELAEKGRQELIKALDKNGNGEVDIEDIMIIGINSPGVKINGVVTNI